ncbi:MAG TPA: hypothetical protein VMC61_07265 [Methanocella sp.]|nr:hypothetical protein [Methanocella sp.]
MDKLEQEDTAATVFSYLIRGLSNGNREAVKAEIIKKLQPVRELYGLTDEVYPLYVDQCIAHKRFLKVQDAIEAFGDAIASGKISSKDERIMMRWVLEIQNQVRTYGNIKTKRR